MLKIETELIVLALLISWIYPALGAGWLEKIEGRFSALARRRTLSVFLVGVAALGLRAAMLPIEPIPEPVVHDEFGYLLAADTFVHGRLTNPPHPMWKHFETFEVLQKPTYQCFSPPAQGVILALGQVLMKHPYWGVWLSVGAMCAAITWMLQGWLAPEWALLGGVLAILRFGPLTYWGNSYWGGAHAAIGGALVLGALPRIRSSCRVRDAVVMGAGLAILANSRPYEGLVFSLPIAGALFTWMLGKHRPTFLLSCRRVILPLTLVLALTATSLGYYCWRVTGSPLRMPAQVAAQTYGGISWMLWRPVKPVPMIHNAAMQKMYAVDDMVYYKVASSLPGLLAKIIVGWRFFFGPALTLPFLMLLMTLPGDFRLRLLSSSTKFLLLTLGIFVIGSAIETWYNPHYSAPATGLIIIFVVLAMHRLRDWSDHGLFLSRALVVICVLSFTVRALAAPLHIPLSEYYEFAWYQKGAPGFGRAAIETELRALRGNHLVIVRYKPDHESFAEWVYNDSDIDHSRVVWARELGGEQDQRLIDYFKGRQVWLLEADEKPPRLEQYPHAAVTESGALQITNQPTRR